MEKYIKILKRLIVVCIISILIFFYCFCRDRTFLNVNKNNREMIIECLEGETKNEKKLKRIRKVAFVMYWLSPEIYVYYIFGKTDRLPADEGGTGSLANYIRENGYKEADIAIWGIRISSIIIILCTICLIIMCIIKHKNMRKSKEKN